MQGAQLCLTARFQPRAWKRENIYEEAPVFSPFFGLTKKKKKKKTKTNK